MRFAAVGLDHPHVFGQTRGLLEAGAELVASATLDGDSPVARTFRAQAQGVPVRAVDEVIADPDIDLVVIAAAPDQRASISLAALRAGKHVVSDKPGCISFDELDELRRAVGENRRFWSVTFSERFEVPAVARAGELVREGRIGRVVQTLGLGPHREASHLAGGGGRPDWFYDERRYGGILVDIASHQIDQFLWFTGSESGEVVSSAVGNYAHPEHPDFQDFGEMVLSGVDGARGYIRVDWFTPDGLPTWGDGRLLVLGTEGYLEIRKYVDVSGAEGGNHLIWVDAEGVHREDCSGRPLSYYADIVRDVAEGTRTAASQEHTFEVCRLALEAQRVAVRHRG
ncbi:Gfo/Idh/MocA family protein [Aestuariimicrobium ganziense]|uniref:Gfo/Idh/MocA family protein n=1 Tax=Aestuariimicrobium ganziense TaxID=2773677 RepID=UPI001943BF27|nr:Gfo/Idh/MocA family oxidoreductase [Aestuariimicrobium ganziense]